MFHLPPVPLAPSVPSLLKQQQQQPKRGAAHALSAPAVPTLPPVLSAGAPLLLPSLHTAAASSEEAPTVHRLRDSRIGSKAVKKTRSFRVANPLRHPVKLLEKAISSISDSSMAALLAGDFFANKDARKIKSLGEAVRGAVDSVRYLERFPTTFLKMRSAQAEQGREAMDTARSLHERSLLRVLADLSTAAAASKTASACILQLDNDAKTVRASQLPAVPTYLNDHALPGPTFVVVFVPSGRDGDGDGEGSNSVRGFAGQVLVSPSSLQSSVSLRWKQITAAQGWIDSVAAHHVMYTLNAYALLVDEPKRTEEVAQPSDDNKKSKNSKQQKQQQHSQPAEDAPDAPLLLPSAEDVAVAQQQQQQPQPPPIITPVSPAVVGEEHGAEPLLLPSAADATTVGAGGKRRKGGKKAAAAAVKKHKHNVASAAAEEEEDEELAAIAAAVAEEAAAEASAMTVEGSADE
jgi:hypothetical protein